MIDRANKNEAGNPSGSNQYKSVTVDNINSSIRPTGTSKKAGLRTLRSRRPDLHEKVINSELSVNAAMIEAGFRKKKN